jgi:hypothetical protein
LPLPVSGLLSLAEVHRFVVDATAEDKQPVATVLIEAGITGAISATGCLHSSAHPNPARYFAHPVLGDRQNVPAAAWGGPIDWRLSRVGRYDLVRVERAEIERWLGTAVDKSRTEEQPGVGPEPQAADAVPRDAQRAARGKQTMEAAAREFIVATYPNGIPAGKTNKMISAEYTNETHAPMSARTVRRARTVKR